MEDGLERRCQRCSGPVVETKLTAFAGTGALVPRNPKYFDSRSSRLVALTCTACGYTEFFAADPSNLSTGGR